MGLLDYLRILKFFIILFLSFCFYVPNQNGKVLEETPPGFDSDDVKMLFFEMSTLFQNDPYSFASTSKNLSQFLCHIVTHNREYYEWF